MLSLLTVDEAAEKWDSIAFALHRAVALDPHRDEQKVKDLVSRGSARIWRLRGELQGYLATTMRKEADGPTFWILYYQGHGTPKAARRLVRQLETIARQCGCRWFRFCGRNWRGVFKDYDATQTEDGRWHFRKDLSNVRD